MHVDPSDFYVSPPSSTPIKQLQLSPATPEPASESPCVLQDMKDLESKVYCYIKNFSKTKPS